MGTRGLYIVCFRGRYYIRFNRYDSYYEGLGAKIVASIPEDPEKYKEWLASMRARHASKEQALEEGLHTIREDGSPPAEDHLSFFDEYVALPAELPRLGSYDAEFFYTINLDAEVLTMNHALHWRLDSIPRVDQQWLQAITPSAYRYVPTVKPELRLDDCLTSLAVPLPDHDMDVWDVDEMTVREARTQLDAPDKVWRACVAADVWSVYGQDIACLGRQWYPHDLPFRELAFALVSLAAGLTAFRSFHRSNPDKPDVPACHPRFCENWTCNGEHLDRNPGWLGQEWLVGGDRTQSPLLTFCSPAHRTGRPPGTASPETKYWLNDDVLVCLTLVVDGAAITEAMRWGMVEQKRRGAEKSSRHSGVRFYMVVLSLFDVVFAEVSRPAAAAASGNGSKEAEEEKKPDLVVSSKLPLSPLREAFCLSTHPRERPVPGPGQKTYYCMPHNGMDLDAHERSVNELRYDFPGIAAMANFFSAVAGRRAATNGTAAVLPPELYARILDLVDYSTWQNCLVVSPDFRALCLARYRLDDRTAIISGPSMIPHPFRGELLMAFKFRDSRTGQIETAIRMRKSGYLGEYNWMPLLCGSGEDRPQALMLDVCLLFESLSGVVESKKRMDNRRAGAAEKDAAEKAAVTEAIAEIA
ncbi:hypothetical protein SPI_09290 [Niveomyces insectorum RCEF 264]|uniref:F-box domain-containing protein n=1 Tax=Niveomyces insectorum RCEF 264 TaxID=1081102 RepID=A0A167LVW9_9HYPO|nr:hypothetical protein SPI_09290 [Niveomyces insectorum RCEF 264]